MKTSAAQQTFGLAVVSCVLTSACRDQNAEQVVERAPGQVEVAPASLDFGGVTIGSMKTRFLELSNRGIAPIRICLPRVTSEACPVASGFLSEVGPFSWPRPDMWWVLEAGESRRFTIGFEPPASGTFEGTLALAHDASDQPVSIPIRGVGVMPDLKVTPEGIDFGAGMLGEPRRQVLELVNQGPIELPVEVSLSTATPGAFALGDQEAPTEPVQLLIGPAKTTTIAVWYRPQEEALHSGAVAIRYCANCLAQVPLGGRAVKPLVHVSPPTLDFGSHSDQESPSLPLLIESVGRNPVTVTSIELVLGTAREFQVALPSPLPIEIPAGGRLEVPVTHRGDSPGIDVGQLMVRTNGWDDPATQENEAAPEVGLVGRSLGPDVEVAPSELDFGTTPIGRASERLLTISNLGNEPLAISDLDLTGDPTFSLVRPALPLTLAASESIVLRLRYVPASEAPGNARLAILSNDRDETAKVIPLQGTGGTPRGCALFLSPLAPTFGAVEPGRSSTLNFELKNEGGAACQVSHLTLTGPAEIALRPGQPTSFDVPQNDVVHLPVTYSPRAPGDHSAVLRLRTTDASQPSADIYLDGSSTAPMLRVLPSAVSLSAPGGCRGILPISIYAMGNVQVTSVAFEPSSSRELSVQAPVLPLSLSTNGAAQVELRYQPTDRVADTGLLYVQHSASPQPTVVPVSGATLQDPTVTDRFTLASPSALDVLVIMRNNSATTQERDAFAQGLAGFFTQAQGVDHRVGVLSSDLSGSTTGQLLQSDPARVRIITRDTPAPATVFAANLAVRGGWGDQLFEAGFLALTSPRLTGPNDGFLRQEAQLAVIFLSDDDDGSSRPLELYRGFLEDLKRRPERLTAHAVVGTVSGGCRGSFGSVNYAPRVLSLTHALGGLALSMCTADWPGLGAQLTAALLGPNRRVGLSAVPDPNTLAVQVGSTPLSRLDGSGVEQWWYDPAGRVLTLAPSVPLAGGARLEVSYRTACP